MSTSISTGIVVYQRTNLVLTTPAICFPDHRLNNECDESIHIDALDGRVLTAAAGLCTIMGDNIRTNSNNLLYRIQS